MNVLSLFDGMSCGQQALERAGFKIDNYFASEIDKYAIQVTMANYPKTIQLGSVVDIDGCELPKIDLLIGGSPCQSFSFAGKRKGMSTKDEQEILTLSHYLELKKEGYEFEGQSYLFWEYMRLLNETKPKYFLLENVMMGEKWEKILSKAIGVNPIEINSSLVSAQNRRRLYWTNIGMQAVGLFGDMESIIKQPKDKGILLKDILQDNPNAKYYLSVQQVDKVLGRTGVDPSIDEPKILDVYNKKIKEDGKPITLTDPCHNNLRLIEPIVGQAGYEKGFKENDKASTLLQRDYKGMNNYGINVVLTPMPVDEKYYLSDKMIAGFEKHKERHTEKGTGFKWKPKDGSEKGNALRANAALCPTDNSIKEVKQVNQTNLKSNGGTQLYQQDRIYDIDGISPALSAGKSDLLIKKQQILTSRIRRLTPIECERLQTVSDNYTNHVSDSQRYKMLGNGWTVDVISHIFSYLDFPKQ
jgi:DNA-cytosine methyltransferase